jgi:hypothetical protein
MCLIPAPDKDNVLTLIFLLVGKITHDIHSTDVVACQNRFEEDQICIHELPTHDTRFVGHVRLCVTSTTVADCICFGLGTVVRVGNARPECIEMTFACLR